MKVTSHTAGSWFPTGFYGHHRMRNRSDFLNEYRHLAKPQPPDAFLHRSSQPTTSHAFSSHDNRHLFANDVTTFGQGHGKKKHPERSESFKSGMMWSSHISNSNSGRPLMSSYKRDFKMDEPNIQMLVKRPMTSFDGPPATTMYRTVHGTDSPNYHFINAMSNESLMLSLHDRQHQAIQKKEESQDSVAACLSWYKPRVPSVTRNQEFNHIYMQPTLESGINTGCCPQTSSTSVLSEGTAVNLVQEACNPVQNVSD